MEKLHEWAPGPGETVKNFEGRHDLRSRLSWPAVFAGMVIAVVTQLMFMLLGLAIGVTVLDTGDSMAEVRGTGIGVGIFYLVSTLLSLFAGGFVAGLGARDVARSSGMIVGLVVWATSTLFTIWIVSRGLSSLLSLATGTVSVSGSTMQNTIPQNIPSPGAILPSPGQQTLQTARNASAIGTWIAFATMALSALAATLGGMLGSAMNRKRFFDRTGHTGGDERVVRREQHYVGPVPPLHPSET